MIREQFWRGNAERIHLDCRAAHIAMVTQGKTQSRQASEAGRKTRGSGISRLASGRLIATAIPITGLISLLANALSSNPAEAIGGETTSEIGCAIFWHTPGPTRSLASLLRRELGKAWPSSRRVQACRTARSLSRGIWPVPHRLHDGRCVAAAPASVTILASPPRRVLSGAPARLMLCA